MDMLVAVLNTCSKERTTKVWFHPYITRGPARAEESHQEQDPCCWVHGAGVCTPVVGYLPC